MKPIQVGLLGLGVVGGGTFTILNRNREEIARRAGREIKVTMAAVRESDLEAAVKKTGSGITLTTNPADVVGSPDVDIVAELMGGIHPARELVLQAIANGKHVVTANKALLALHGNEIFKAAHEKGVMVAFEAAVAGGIPIIKALREGLTANRIEWIAGIINGTSNFILTRMRDEGAGFADALKEAQALGYAESDPTADIEGHDAAAKAALLASLAFHSTVTIDEVYTEGISNISSEDVAAAKSMNSVIKLLAIAELTVKDEISVRVHPVILPLSHPLASVRNAFNAVYVESESAGQLMFYGRGAGGAPTASAILGDLVAVTRHAAYSTVGYGESDYADLDIAPIGAVKSQFFVRLHVADKSGVLAAIASTFSSENVSIQTVRQAGLGEDAELIVVTHAASEDALVACVESLRKLDIVRNVESVIRVEGAPV